MSIRDMAIDSGSNYEFTRRAMETINRKTEEVMLAQLGDLVKEGLLVWVQGPKTFHYDPIESKMHIVHLGRLVLKEAEVFERLKKERDDWREKYEKLQAKVDACFKE